MDVPAYHEYWHRRLARDLAPFSDPGTLVRLDPAGGRVAAAWTSRGEDLEATFTIAAERDVSVVFNGKAQSYRSFLSSEAMADLRGLARMILKAHKVPFFVRTKAHETLVDGIGPSKPAVELISTLLVDDGPAGLTQIVFVTGEAGAGKTQVLRQLVKDQAFAYEQGRSNHLLLYINAQGRALARFNEALATELQDLRSRVTYHALAALVRAGLVIPVVDGFDELLGATGYEDAFASLAGFIEELDGQGRMIAAARSSYYELEFVARANTESSLGSQAWRLSPVEIEEWGPSEFEEFLALALDAAHLSGEERRDVAARVERGFEGRNRHLAGKPFFVARAFALAHDGVTFTSDSDLLDQLVMAYLDRECSHKLVDRSERPLLAAKQLRELMVNVAEEMWNQETRELDRRSLREVVEYTLADHELPSESKDMVITRAPTLAFLKPVGELSRVGFEHEVFFSYFLAEVFSSALTGAEIRLRVLLGRSQISEDVAYRAAVVVTSEIEVARSVVGRLSACAVVDDRRSPQIQENAGVITAWVMREASSKHGSIDRVSCRGMKFPGISFDGAVVVESRLENVFFFRTDLRRARFLRCSGSHLAFSDAIVDESFTRLEFNATNLVRAVVGLRVVTNEGIETKHDPERIRKALIACGALAEASDAPASGRAVRDDVVALLERLARAYNRCNPITPDDGSIRNVFNQEVWPGIEELLIRHGVVTAETRSAGGSRKRFLRRQFLPEQLMAGLNPAATVPSSIRRFWEDLEMNFPQ